MRQLLIAPSLLSADFADMGGALDLIETAGADWAHLDVMDGRFVPSITFGPKMVADLRPRTKIPFDVHLMTVEPERIAPAFLEAGADYLTFHIEACVHAHRLVEEIRDAGAHPGIALVPSAPLVLIEELLSSLDLVLVMTVNPGFGGQRLIPSCLEKVRRLVRLRSELGLDFKISVDGGVNRGTLAAIVAAGAEVAVMGSAFFSSSNPTEEVAQIREMAAAVAV